VEDDANESLQQGAHIGDNSLSSINTSKHGDLGNQPETITVEGPPLGTQDKSLKTTNISWCDSFASFLATPRSVMVLIPLLVFSLGVLLTIIGQSALNATSKKMATERFVSHTSSVALRLENTLGQAEPLLDELARVARGISEESEELERATRIPLNASIQPLTLERLAPIALEMRNLLIGRPGISLAYIAFADGRFLSADPDADGRIEFRITHQGRSTSFGIEGQRIRELRSEQSEYDPREREWYNQAKDSRGRIWSEPYAFYLNHHAGVTKAAPIYLDLDRNNLLAVVGVDFDVHALTDFMADGETPSDDVHSVVFTLKGAILAYPRGAEALAQLPLDDQVPTHDALEDSKLSALIARVQSLRQSELEEKLVTYREKGQKFLASLRKVGAGAPDWYVATFSPERVVFVELYSHRQSSLIIGTLALFIAVGLSWLLARRILAVKKEISLAQAAVRVAQHQVRDLGSYRLIRKIGEGGMGEVWQARHHLLARQAAIKLIKQDSTSPRKEAEQRERFRREAQAIAGLRSRHTVALFDYGVTPKGTLFYVMELLDGVDLSTLVTEHGPQPAERVRQILIQACNSLAEAHSAGLVHRDIKPANLFLCREAEEIDVVKVLDFGLVYQPHPPGRLTTNNQPQPPESTLQLGVQGMPQTRITHADHQLGTPAFMSPEQAMGEITDGRSDIYSLACVAWWLLRGEPLFSAPTHLALMLKHVEEPARSLGPQYPKNFTALIEKCLEKSPQNRPQSAHELGRALQELGSLSSNWTQATAHSWWNLHLPLGISAHAHLSLPPLRDAEVLAPDEPSE